MVTNVLLTIDEITYESLRVLKNKLGLGNRVLRKFDSSFGIEGAKIGDTLRVRKPPRYQTTTGAAPAQQATTETFVPVSAATQRNVLLSYSTKDYALALDNFSDNIISPSMAQLASDVDTDGTLAVTNGYTVANSTNYGGQYGGTYAGFFNLATPGKISGTTGPAQWTGNSLGSSANSVQTALQPFFDASARLTEQAAPKEDRYAVLSPSAMAATIPFIATNFNPSAQISEAFSQGIVTMAAGASWFESPSTQLFTSGNWAGNSSGNGNVAVSSSNGDQILAVGRVGNANTWNPGDQFVVAGVGAVNPLTRQGTGFLQVFTVTANATSNATGNVTLSVYPAIQPNGQGQTINTAPVAGANVTWLGTPATPTQANFMYQKDAVALVVANLADVGGYGAECTMADNEDDGMSIRIVTQYQGLTDQIVRRVDFLYGWGVVRPELGCRIQA